MTPALSGAGGLVVVVPLAVEAAALRPAAARGARIVRAGMGSGERGPRERAVAAARAADAVAVAGFAGSVDERVSPGDLVLADELRDAAGTAAVGPPGLSMLAGALRRRGLRVHVGPIAEVDRVVRGREARAHHAASGALVVDMESARLARAAAGPPLVVLRAVVDAPGSELTNPLATLRGYRAARRALRRAAPVLAEWAEAAGGRDVLLAAPRASCAGVHRAIETVERALERHGAPVYVRRQIVHNREIVDELTRRGAIFVEEVDEVPEGALTVFSAHGVAPAVRDAARRRRLQVVDATCPLVAKVHAEARRLVAGGHTVVLVGHEGHEEVEGVVGEAPGKISVVATPREAAELDLPDAAPVAWLSQTTLAVDERDDVVAALAERFPDATGPPTEDICFATSNRQEAVRAIAGRCDAVVVVGSSNSSNGNRLVEVAERAGARAVLVDHPGDLDLRWLRGVRTVGVTAAASTPERAVRRMVAALGPGAVEEVVATVEQTSFKLPPEPNDRNS